MRIARESAPFLLIFGLASLAAAWLHPAVAVPPVLLLLFTVWFFRDPERTTPDEAGALISPADGKIIVVGPERISIFLNVFNVHVCRTPQAGEVRDVQHVSGRFLAAFKDDASEHNERTAIVVADGTRTVRFVLVAGLVARRIVCKVRPGQRLGAGERIGLIRFGSRVDVDLPPGVRPAVALGQRVVAGETVIARAAGGGEPQA